MGKEVLIKDLIKELSKLDTNKEIGGVDRNCKTFKDLAILENNPITIDQLDIIEIDKLDYIIY